MKNEKEFSRELRKMIRLQCRKKVWSMKTDEQKNAEIDALVETARRVVRTANGLRGYEMNWGSTAFFAALRDLEKLCKQCYI